MHTGWVQLEQRSLLLQCYCKNVMVRMSDVIIGGSKRLLFGKTSTDMPWYHSIRHTSRSIENQRENLLIWCPPIIHAQIKVWNFIRQDCCLVECYSRELLRCCRCNINSCWSSAFTATNTAAVPICLLVECCCKMDACWVFATQSWMLAGVVLLYLPYLLVLCLTISRACWCDASL